MNIDPTGTAFFATLLIGSLIAGLINGAFRAIGAAINGGSGRDVLGSFVGGFITGAVLGAASILGGGLAVGALTATVGSVIGIGAATAAVSFGGGVLANWAESSIKGKIFNLTDALNQGALTMFAGLTNFGVGYAMGAAGLWNSLKPENSFAATMRVAKDYFKMEAGYTGIKNMLGGVFTYLGINIFSMVARSIIKYVFTKPWKNAIATI